MVLSDAEAAACAAVVAAPEAWSRWEDVEQRHGAAVLDSLVLAGVFEAWIRPDYVAVTLTPFGAWLAGVELDEVWRPGIEEHEERDEARPVASAVVTRERVLLETPVWRETGGRPKPIRLPKHGRVGSTLVRPERVEAKEVEPEEDEFVRGPDGAPLVLLGVRVRKG